MTDVERFPRAGVRVGRLQPLLSAAERPVGSPGLLFPQSLPNGSQRPFLAALLPVRRRRTGRPTAPICLRPELLRSAGRIAYKSDGAGIVQTDAYDVLVGNAG